MLSKSNKLVRSLCSPGACGKGNRKEIYKAEAATRIENLFYI